MVTLRQSRLYANPGCDEVTHHEIQLRWPDKIYLVKFENKEHADTHYTRGKAILFPQSDLMTELPLKQPEFFSAIVAHELFHILIDNPELKTLYAAIGFIPCGEVELPSDLAETQNL